MSRGLTVSMAAILPQIGQKQIEMIDFWNLLDKSWDVFKETFRIFIVQDVQINTVSTTCNERRTVVQTTIENISMQALSFSLIKARTSSGLHGFEPEQTHVG